MRKEETAFRLPECCSREFERFVGKRGDPTPGPADVDIRLLIEMRAIFPRKRERRKASSREVRSSPHSILSGTAGVLRARTLSGDYLAISPLRQNRPSPCGRRRVLTESGVRRATPLALRLRRRNVGEIQGGRKKKTRATPMPNPRPRRPSLVIIASRPFVFCVC